MNGAPVATRYTRDFVHLHKPEGAREILEIGCGAGELAAELVRDGLSVIAIDSDAECVAAALTLGVDARHLAWPVELNRKFDCVLFTRSLHHVDDLNRSVTAAREALHSTGRLLIEDFRAEGASARSETWYAGLTRTLSASGAFTDDFDLNERIAAAKPDHDHHLHSSTVIAEALRCFGHIEHGDAAYFFRYLEGRFRQAEVSKELLDYELSLIEAGSIDALGKRYVAYQ